MNKKQIYIVGGILLIVAIVTIIALLINKQAEVKLLAEEEKQSPLLIINTDKNHYQPGEEVYIQMSSLDTSGKILCDSKLELTITYNEEPMNNILVNKSSSCIVENNFSNSPDYSAFFKPESEGTYKITLKNNDLNVSAWTEITVDNNVPDIAAVRWSATRIDLVEKPRYPMVITITSNKDFSGTVTDSLPAGFSFAWYGEGLVSEANGSKTITWNVDFKKGEVIELKYEYVPEKTDACVFDFGPLTVAGKTIDSVWKVTPNIECLSKLSLFQGTKFMYRSKPYLLNTKLSLSNAVFI